MIDPSDEHHMYEALAMLAERFGLKADPTKPIPLAEIIGTSGNGIPGLGHDKCGGVVTYATMFPLRGPWICSSCNGFVTEQDAKPKLQEGRDGFKAMVELLRPKPRGHEITEAEKQKERIETVTTLFQEGRITAQVPNCIIGGHNDFDVIGALLEEGSIVAVTTASRNRKRCLKQKCRHQGHYTYLTPEGLQRYRKEIWHAYSKNPHRKPVSRKEFDLKLDCEVLEIASLPAA